LKGKIELELELLTEEESMQRPAGRGREAPNENPKLDEPKRPDASFLWFASPLRTFKFIVWRRYKCTFFLTLLLILLVFLILIMIYTMPVF
jgi:dysferlin